MQKRIHYIHTVLLVKCYNIVIAICLNMTLNFTKKTANFMLRNKFIKKISFAKKKWLPTTKWLDYKFSFLFVILKLLNYKSAAPFIKKRKNRLATPSADKHEV